MDKKMEEITKKISSVSVAVSVIKDAISRADIWLLQNYKIVMRRIMYVTPEPQMEPRSLINVASHLGSLKYCVWGKMLDTVPYVPVTLDPNTAASSLHLSEDLTSVRETEDRQKLSENPERISSYSGVLGSEGFSSGTHCWDVEVGKNSCWIVGVAKESISRKKAFAASQMRGFWGIGLFNGAYGVSSSLATMLKDCKNLQKVHVQLDYDKGMVTFSDLADNSFLYMFKDHFNEKVFPYFYIKDGHPLKIQPVKVCPQISFCPDDSR